MGNGASDYRLRESLRMLVRKLGMLEDSQITCCGVTLAQCNAIVEIGRAESISLNELAEQLNLDNSTMSRTVNNLVNGELAKRELDPQDRRYVTISLTEKGRNMFQSIESGMEQQFLRIYESISEEKRNQVIESLEILINAFNKCKCC